MLKQILSFFSILLLFTVLVSAQQTVTLRTQGVSPDDVHHDETGFLNIPYNGLTNVGINTKIYLKATGTRTFGAANFEVSSKPATSIAVIDSILVSDTNIIFAAFSPDVLGKYVITFSDGEATATLTFNAGIYLGLEGGNCVLCHSEYVEKWQVTGHADIFTRALEGTLSNHYSASCVPCHTTGYDANAANNGFDDREFVLPAELTTGVFDNMVAMYPEAMQLANVQCESCHGPGYAHGGAVSMSTSLSVDNCAYCHAEGPRHIFPQQWKYSGSEDRGFHGGHAMAAFVGYAGGRGGCSECHSGSGFVQWVKEGAQVDAIGQPVRTSIVPEPTAITCAACHDPHDNTLPYQLRVLGTQLSDGVPLSFEDYGTGTLCMNCHRSRRNVQDYLDYPSDVVDNLSRTFGPHHGPQADMLLASNAYTFGLELPTSPHAQATENACVDCHMANGTYPDAIDEDGNIKTFGGHTFNMVNQDGEHHVASCEPCHGNFGDEFGDKKYYVNGKADLDGDGNVEGLQDEVHGLLEELAALLPKDQNGNVAVNDSSVTVVQARAAFNYFFVEEDRSFGVHNPAFTVALLKASIEAVGGVTYIDYPEGEIPQDFQLSQNYPNPFNPTTKIKFSLPQSAHVKLVIYDVLGKEITKLVEGDMSAGSHEVQFNASNMASGVYIYKIDAGDFSSIKKMLLMK